MSKKESKKGNKKESKKEDNGERKEKKKNKNKEKKLLTVTSNKANPKSDIDPRTGTRFSPNSARQQAFDIIYEMADKGENAKAIREKLKSARKDNGNKFNLDPGYLHYVIAMHPEIFEAYSDGEIKVIGKPKVDKAAAKKMEEDAEAKKKRAAVEREKRKKNSDGDNDSGDEKKKKKKKKKPEVKE